MTRDTDTEQKIFTAAREVFYKKGFGGARMEEIAQEAGMNKALLHYYFRSKQALFEKILTEALGQVFPGLQKLLVSDIGFREKVDAIIDFYFDLLTGNPYLPMFVLHALQQEGDGFAEKYFRHLGFGPEEVFKMFTKQIQGVIAAGEIRPISPPQLFLHIVGLTVFPFIVRPIVKHALGVDDTAFRQLLVQRRQEVHFMIWQGLKPEK